MLLSLLLRRGLDFDVQTLQLHDANAHIQTGSIKIYDSTQGRKEREAKQAKRSKKRTANYST